MKRTLPVLRLVLLLSLSALAQTNQLHRPVHTFSIVARDSQTGEIGVAVQSHWFSVGQMVPWAEAGVGAVATQSFVDPSYGAKGLELMRVGKSSFEALRTLTLADKGRDVRQVAMVDAKGQVAVWTGPKDIQAAGHCAGQIELTVASDSQSSSQRFVETCEAPQATNMTSSPTGRLTSTHGGYAVQANLMSNDQVWPAMAKAFESAKGDLADRMLAALDAGQAVGGDIRGRQSAAIIVVKAKSSGKPWEDRIFDLRVDDSTEPLKELRRLVTLQRAYNEMNAGDLATEHNDNDAALKHYSTAEQIMESAPNTDLSRLAEAIYWHAVALVNMKRVDESLPLFKRSFQLHPQWRELTPRLPKSGLLPDDAALIKRITAQ
jgi:uncharacterized Ntn-hydrolase superfamily protein